MWYENKIWFLWELWCDSICVKYNIIFQLSNLEEKIFSNWYFVRIYQYFFENIPVNSVDIIIYSNLEHRICDSVCVKQHNIQQYTLTVKFRGRNTFIMISCENWSIWIIFANQITMLYLAIRSSHDFCKWYIGPNDYLQNSWLYLVANYFLKV